MSVMKSPPETMPPDEAQRHRDIERTLNRILSLSLRGATMDETLRLALAEVLSIEWLCFDRCGAVFLTDEMDPSTLRMAVASGLPPEVMIRCWRVPFGTCLCGRVAASGEGIHAEAGDMRHDVETCEGPHGHFCVPIKDDGTLLGVINLYIRDGHEPCDAAEALLDGVADVLAGVVSRERDRLKLAESEERLGAIVEAFDGLVYMNSPDYEIEFMNEQFVELLGQDPLGEKCYRAIHGFKEPCEWCVNAAVFSGETCRWEVQLKQNGRHYSVTNRLIAHPGGGMSKLSMAMDIDDLKKAELALRVMNENLQGLLGGVVDALSDTTSQRDPYTAIHQDRVARLGCAIAEELGMDEEFVDGLRIAGKLHDIGKIAVPASILSKPGTLSDMEMGIVRTHSTSSYTMLEHVPFERPVAKAVLQHHERLDGSGYPDGLLGDEILPEAKIIAVADVVEAMASHRPYRPSLGVKVALKEVTGAAGTKYDAEIVDACVRVIETGAFEL